MGAFDLKHCLTPLQYRGSTAIKPRFCTLSMFSRTLFSRAAAGWITQLVVLRHDPTLWAPDTLCPGHPFYKTVQLTLQFSGHLPQPHCILGPWYLLGEEASGISTHLGAPHLLGTCGKTYGGPIHRTFARRTIQLGRVIIQTHLSYPFAEGPPPGRTEHAASAGGQAHTSYFHPLSNKTAEPRQTTHFPGQWYLHPFPLVTSSSPSPPPHTYTPPHPLPSGTWNWMD